MVETTGMIKVGLHAPDGEFETMWATPAGAGRYRLENSPFFAYRVSWQDVVEARPEDESGLPVVQCVVEKSGHRTLRLILSPGPNQAPEQQRILNQVTELGCTYEAYNERYYAIDVPPGIRLEPVVEYLTRDRQEWEYVDPSYDQLFPEPPSGSASTAS